MVIIFIYKIAIQFLYCKTKTQTDNVFNCKYISIYKLFIKMIRFYKRYYLNEHMHIFIIFLIGDKILIANILVV